MDGKQNGRVAGTVLVGVPAPQRQDKRIALLPFELFVADPRRARAAEGVIDSAIGVAVRRREFAGPRHLRAHKSVWAVPNFNSRY